MPKAREWCQGKHVEVPLWCALLGWELTWFWENPPQYSSSCRQLAIAKNKGGNNSSRSVYCTTKVLDWRVSLALHSTVQALKHRALLRSPGALCMQCLWVCSCQGLQWGLWALTTVLGQVRDPEPLQRAHPTKGGSGWFRARVLPPSYAGPPKSPARCVC